jgi:hypothetical protein
MILTAERIAARLSVVNHEWMAPKLPYESKLSNGTKSSFTYDAANQKKGVVNVNSSNTTLSYYNYQFDGVGDRTSVWDNGVDVSNWNYDFTGQLTNDVYRPATTALNWNGLTVDQWFLLDEDGWDNLLVDHVPTNVAISLRCLGRGQG